MEVRWNIKDLEPPIKYLCSCRAYVLHVFDAADAIVGNFAAGDTDVVPESSLPICAKPAHVT